VVDARAVLFQDVTAVIAYLPHLLGAIVIALVGWLVAWLVGRILGGILHNVGFDGLAERRGLIDDLTRIGVRTRPSLLVGRLAFLIVLIATSVQAVDTLELAPLSDALRSLLTYTPHLVLALVLLLAGVIVGDTIARGATEAMSRAGVMYHGITGSVLRATIIVLAVLLALQQLTIESGFLLDVFLVVLCGGALAVGISGGWGTRNLVENFTAARYVERYLHVGDRISVEGLEGTVERLDPTSTLVTSLDGRRIVVPNGVLARVPLYIGAKPDGGVPERPSP
jgi:small-conductance mechanosensitive channel